MYDALQCDLMRRMKRSKKLITIINTELYRNGGKEALYEASLFQLQSICVTSALQPRLQAQASLLWSLLLLDEDNLAVLGSEV